MAERTLASRDDAIRIRPCNAERVGIRAPHSQLLATDWDTPRIFPNAAWLHFCLARIRPTVSPRRMRSRRVNCLIRVTIAQCNSASQRKSGSNVYTQGTSEGARPQSGGDCKAGWEVLWLNSELRGRRSEEHTS